MWLKGWPPEIQLRGSSLEMTNSLSLSSSLLLSVLWLGLTNMGFLLPIIACLLALSLFLCLSNHIIGDIMGAGSLSFLGHPVSQWSSWSFVSYKLCSPCSLSYITPLNVPRWLDTLFLRCFSAIVIVTMFITARK